MNQSFYKVRDRKDSQNENFVLVGHKLSHDALNPIKNTKKSVDLSSKSHDQKLKNDQDKGDCESKTKEENKNQLLNNIDEHKKSSSFNKEDSKQNNLVTQNFEIENIT